VSGFGADQGASLGESISNSVKAGMRWPPPTWKFGTRPSDDRRGM
jgi:hypothetical protein